MRSIRFGTLPCLLIVCSVAFLQAQAPKPAAAGSRDSPASPSGIALPVQGFSLVLLLGETQGTIPTQGLSSPARKALSDIREFLPYKGYRLLDTQWVAGKENAIITGRLRGLDDSVYDFILTVFPRAGAAAQGTADAALDHARFRLVAGKSGILETFFNIHAGETVVVGTSHLQADQALVVLLSAVTSDQIGNTGRGVR